MDEVDSIREQVGRQLSVLLEHIEDRAPSNYTVADWNTLVADELNRHPLKYKLLLSNIAYLFIIGNDYFEVYSHAKTICR